MRMRLMALALAALLVIAAGLAAVTWRGALWPFDIRVSALMLATALGAAARGAGPAMLLHLGAGFLLRRPLAALLWTVPGTGIMLALHGAAGPARGFLALDRLGIGPAIVLWAPAVALTALAGALLTIGRR
ncbi:hypothetical protein ORIO_21775 (plasmid) [Cereibacter azotoformans]|uniref:hypothetical protein n=1 Tax=Cereibacter azotoformans TaxID=43057 RepID=UPI001EEB46F2|nr:hypothetical protein [Cereibacter azotoformans]ULB12417.1 hypothetical protein ORIO_21775 [Cereibacter azotoformans]